MVIWAEIASLRLGLFKSAQLLHHSGAEVKNEPFSDTLTDYGTLLYIELVVKTDMYRLGRNSSVLYMSPLKET